MIADQLGHSRVSMTQDAYLDRRSRETRVAAVLERVNPARTAQSLGSRGTARNDALSPCRELARGLEPLTCCSSADVLWPSGPVPVGWRLPRARPGSGWITFDTHMRPGDSCCGGAVSSSSTCAELVSDGCNDRFTARRGRPADQQADRLALGDHAGMSSGPVQARPPRPRLAAVRGVGILQLVLLGRVLG
jgi:hypothetical protein